MFLMIIKAYCIITVTISPMLSTQNINRNRHAPSLYICNYSIAILRFIAEYNVVCSFLLCRFALLSGLLARVNKRSVNVNNL